MSAGHKYSPLIGQEDEYSPLIGPWLPVARSFYRSGASLGQETSQTLDYLLFESGYNRRVRPDTGGPVVVNVNLAIR